MHWNNIVRNEYRKRNRITKKVYNKNIYASKTDLSRFAKTEDPNFEEKYLNKLNDKLEEIQHQRFSAQSKETFDSIKRITKYKIKARDGSIVSMAYNEGRIIEGAELEDQIMKHFATVNS